MNIHAFDEQVRRRLDKHRGRWQEIADASDVSYSWLCKFARGRITNPGYARLVRLHDCLRQLPRRRPTDVMRPTETPSSTSASSSPVLVAET